MSFTLPRLVLRAVCARPDVKVFYIFPDYPVKSAICAAEIFASSAGEARKTWCGVPAAAQIALKSCKRGSKNARIGVRWPTGDTPPMAKPVCARISAASALPSGSPASAAALAASTWLPPAVTNRMAVPLVSPRKMMDLAIWSMSQPMAVAASAAVRASGVSRTSVSIPAASRAARTRFRLLLMAI